MDTEQTSEIETFANQWANTVPFLSTLSLILDLNPWGVGGSLQGQIPKGQLSRNTLGSLTHNL